MRTVIYAYNCYSEQYLKALEERDEQSLVFVYPYKVRIRQNNCKKELTGQGQ